MKQKIELDRWIWEDTVDANKKNKSKRKIKKYLHKRYRLLLKKGIDKEINLS
jgi:hypothetical protein